MKGRGGKLAEERNNRVTDSWPEGYFRNQKKCQGYESKIVGQTKIAFKLKSHK